MKVRNLFLTLLLGMLLAVAPAAQAAEAEPVAVAWGIPALWPMGPQLEVGLAAPFPNPASSEVTLRFRLPGGAQTATIKFTDILGRTAKAYRVTRELTELTVDVKDLRQGIYFCTLEVEGELVSTRRLAVHH